MGKGIWRQKKYIDKLKGTALEALKQIDSKEYLTPWKGKGETLYKIGVVFEPKKRKIKEWKIRSV